MVQVLDVATVRVCGAEYERACVEAAVAFPRLGESGFERPGFQVCNARRTPEGSGDGLPSAYIAEVSERDDLEETVGWT